MGKEPGDELSHAADRAFITHDVLLRVNNSLTPLNNAERGGWGLQAALGRTVAGLTGAPRAACMEDARHEGQRDASQGLPRCARPLTRTLTVPEPSLQGPMPGGLILMGHEVFGRTLTLP